MTVVSPDSELAQRQRRFTSQLCKKGNVVNVPVDIAPTITSLPRPVTASDIIPIRLKRKKAYKTSVYSENVRPLKVMSALQWLMTNSPVYKDHNISVDLTWNTEQYEITKTNETDEQNESDSDNVSKAVDPTWNSEQVETSKSNETNEQNESDSDSDDFSEIGEEENQTAYVETMLTEDEYDSSCIHTYAPGENQQPISLFHDVDAEYLAFPTVFCGQRRASDADRQTTVHYSDICKWELRSVDRRVACNIPNIFFKLKKLQMKQVSDKVMLVVRRYKTQGMRLTAADILNQDHVNNMVHLDEGYHIFRTLRNSPPYLEKRKKDLMAMIRQLGFPTYFVSLSAADTRWPDLLRVLGQLIDGKTYTDDEIKAFTWEDRTRLIQTDPVTCARFFDHRLHVFINDVLKSTLHPIGIIQDSFIRIEFQQSGSPHAHIMFWIKDSPIYSKSDDCEVVEFVDQHISCSMEVSPEAEDALQMQMHKHSRTCRKGGKSICRFGFPQPSMRQTQILKPLLADDPDHEFHKAHFLQISNVLAENKDGILITFDELLQSLEMSEDDYIQAIRTSIKTTTVFLKRTPQEIRVNPYMRNVLDIYNANHDIQFVTDPYACAVYIVAYMSKSQRGMSLLLNNACKEVRQGNTNLRQQVRTIGNKFVNAVEVSAQEAAYLVLQMAITSASCTIVFIPTSRPEDRIFLMKSKASLQKMDPNDTNNGA